MIKHIAFAGLIGFLAVGAGGEEARRAVSSTHVADFSLADHRGKDWTLSDFSERKLVVLAVVGTECPLAQKYLPRLQQLSEEFAEQGVAFLGINANRQDSLAEMAAQVRTAGITFPMLKDTRQTVITDLQATRTPEVIVLDADRIVRYRGRIDDQHAVGNRSKTSPMRDDLRIALDELLAGKPVSVSQTEPVGCLITRTATPQADAAVTYSNQIARLLQTHCVECHRPGEIAPFSLTEYGEVAGWAEMIVEVTQSGQMPPWHASPKHGAFRNARRLSAEEKQLLVDWVAAGAPEGNPQELPPPREFTQGWQLPREPDQVIAIRDTPFQVPAEGVVKYQYFQVDPQFTTDKWVTAAEIIPSNRAVVHHVIVFFVPEGKRMDGENDSVTAFVPGLRVAPYPDGYAKKIPAGSKLIFQVHYTPNGTPQEDLTKLGLLFMDESQVTHSVYTENVKNTKLLIRPNEDDQRFEARPFTTQLEAELLDLMPHMHLRGKSFRFELAYPDGRRDVLLDVPRYDFNWQTVYLPEQPLIVPKGATFYAEASFDNSAQNLANPNSAQTVTWGEQTWDEMLIGYFNFAIPHTAEAEAAMARFRDSSKSQDHAQRLMKSLDRNGNGMIEQDEVPEKQRAIFARADKDGDGVITAEELAAGIAELRDFLKKNR